MEELVERAIEGLKVMLWSFAAGVLTFVAMVVVPIGVVMATGNEDAAIFAMVAVIIAGLYAIFRGAVRLTQ